MKKPRTGYWEYSKAGMFPTNEQNDFCWVTKSDYIRLAKDHEALVTLVKEALDDKECRRALIATAERFDDLMSRAEVLLHTE